MKLALIGNFTEIYHEEGKARAFQKLGHDVYRFDEKLFDENDKDKIINEIKPDAVIYTKLRIKNQIELVTDLKKNDIKTVCWFPDYCNVGQWENSAFNIKDIKNCGLSNSDLVLLPDANNSAKWKSLGINQHLMRQAISEEFCYKSNKKLNQEFDVVFIGTVIDNDLYNYRFELVNFLRNKYKNKFLHLGGNNPYQVRNSDLNDLISSCKIVIADSPYKQGHPIWSNRVYETLGRGGFCLHSNVPGIETEFEIGKHLDVYEHKNYYNLESKIDYYLKNSSERIKIADAGFEHVKNNFTLNNRCKDVIEKIRQI